MGCITTENAADITRKLKELRAVSRAARMDVQTSHNGAGWWTGQWTGTKWTGERHVAAMGTPERRFEVTDGAVIVHVSIPVGYTNLGEWEDLYPPTT